MGWLATADGACYLSRRQIMMNDLPVGRSVDEALRLLQAFQFTVSFFFLFSSLCG